MDGWRGGCHGGHGANGRRRRRREEREGELRKLEGRRCVLIGGVQGMVGIVGRSADQSLTRFPLTRPLTVLQTCLLEVDVLQKLDSEALTGHVLVLTDHVM